MSTCGYGLLSYTMDDSKGPPHAGPERYQMASVSIVWIVRPASKRVFPPTARKELGTKPIHSEVPVVRHVCGLCLPYISREERRYP